VATACAEHRPQPGAGDLGRTRGRRAHVAVSGAAAAR
jgi:hypothetical protein